MNACRIMNTAETAISFGRMIGRWVLVRFSSEKMTNRGISVS